MASLGTTTANWKQKHEYIKIQYSCKKKTTDQGMSHAETLKTMYFPLITVNYVACVAARLATQDL